MELFSLMAKLTLDADEYNRELDDAQKSADNFESPENQKLELDNSDFNDGLEESEQLTDGFQTSMSTAFDAVKSALTKAGIVGLVLELVKGLKQAIDMTAETADGIDKGSQRLGISTKKYQEWEHALSQSGASITDLQRGVAALNKHLAGEESADITEAYDALGISVKKANGEMKTSEELIEESLTALSRMEEGSERDLLVTKLFGRGGTSLNALLNEGEEGVKELLAEASDLGLIMSEEDIKTAVEYGDAVANLNAELNAIKEAFIVDLLPVLTDGVQWLTSLLEKFNPRLRENALSATFKQIDEESQKSLHTISANKAEAEALVEKLSEMGDYWTLDEDEKKKYDALVEELKELYPQLNEIIGDNTYSINENKDAILANVDAWTKLEQQRIIDENIAEKQKAVAEAYAKALDMQTEAAVKNEQANGQRNLTIEKMNAWLSESGKGYRKSDLFAQTGAKQVTKENFDKVIDFFTEYEEADQNIVKMIQDYDDLKAETDALNESAEKLTKDADDLKEHTEDYANALRKMLGYAESDTKDVREEIAALKKELSELPGNVRISYEPIKQYTHAIGSNYIPFDNYPALLHRGEQVLTATEARRERAANIDLTGLEDAIAKAIRDSMKDVTVDSYLDGDKVTDSVSRKLANQLADRRYL